jgi:hypothetical protein
MHAHEAHAYEMHAYEVHAHEVDPHEMHARKGLGETSQISHLTVMNAKTICLTAEVAVHHRGTDGTTVAGQCSCTSLISRAFPDLWPKGGRD